MDKNQQKLYGAANINFQVAHRIRQQTDKKQFLQKGWLPFMSPQMKRTGGHHSTPRMSDIPQIEVTGLHPRQEPRVVKLGRSPKLVKAGKHPLADHTRQLEGILFVRCGKVDTPGITHAKEEIGKIIWLMNVTMRPSETGPHFSIHCKLADGPIYDYVRDGSHPEAIANFKKQLDRLAELHTKDWQGDP